MANDQSASLGLRPFTQPGQRIRISYYQANTAVDLFRWGPVAKNNSGQVEWSDLIIDASGILGTVVGFIDTDRASLPTNLTSLTQGAFLTNGNDSLVAVADDPSQEFIVEEDTGGTLIGSANSSGQTVHLTLLATSGNTTTGVANIVMDRSTLASDTGGNFILVRPYDEWVNSDGTFNDVSLNFAKWVVRPAHHQNGLMGLNTPAHLPG